MRISLLNIAFSFVISASFAQTIDQVSVGAGYSLQTFYDIESGETTSIDGDSWDISFSTLGFQDAAISLNEGSSTMGVELELYYIADASFDTPVTQADLIDRVYNTESSWSMGAFNSFNDPSNFADYGWGMYNPATMSVSGSKLYVLKLRNGSFKKLMIESLIGTTYNLTYSDLDGSNQKSVSIDKAEFTGKQRAFFSFDSESVLDLEPSNWDLLFTRYSSPVDDGEGNILNYVVTGVLSSEGVEIAQANEIDPQSVSVSDYQNQFDTDIDVIGFDWKDIDITTFQWSLALDRVYFVKTQEDKIYKLFLFDFEGSSTGVTTLEKSEVTTTSNETVLIGDASNVYPNPNNGNFTLALNNEVPVNNAVVSIYNTNGVLMYTESFSATKSLQSLKLQSSLKPGMYNIIVTSKNLKQVQRIIVE